MYKHVNPTEESRAALAPYNFVPLPRAIYPQRDARAVGAALREHDRYAADLHSGYIDLDIEALTPVFVRGAVPEPERGPWDAREARLRPDPATTPDGRPMLPGSSLRGMTRTLVEILSFSRLSFVTGERPFFRTVADDRIGRRYRALLVRGDRSPPGGFARQRPDGQWEIVPARDVLRVEHRHIAGLEYRQHNYRPDWNLQHHRCWFTREERRYRVARLALGDARPDGAGWEEGVLVLTGSSPKKKREFVFAVGDGAAFPIPDAVVERFHDEDQVSQWQERAFPRDLPEPRARRAAGHLGDDEPVFYVCGPRADGQPHGDDNPQELLFFGRAGMFRFPYDRSPRSLAAAQIKREGEAPYDLTELLFGRVARKATDGVAIRGRVRFEDATARASAPAGGWLLPPMVPAVLSAPKVTAFQHYLTQDGTAPPRDLTTYFNDDKTTLRGHKLYWHRGGAELLCEAKHPEHDTKLRDLTGKTPTDTQCTVIRPVKAGVHFGGRVRFDNLTDIELGALLMALQLPKEGAHKIGMAKPLGLGSVRITARLCTIDRAARYTSWEGGAARTDDGAVYTRAFEAAMRSHAETHGETMIAGREGVAAIARIDALYTMLDWEHRPPSEATRSMRIERGDPTRFRADNGGKVNEFKDRPVLPSPHKVAGKEEPTWGGDTPSPAGAVVQREVVRPRAAPVRVEPTRVAPVQATGPKVGATVAVEVLPETTKKGGAKFSVVGTCWKGVLHPRSAKPPDLTPGVKLELVVVTGGADLQLKYVAK